MCQPLSTGQKLWCGAYGRASGWRVFSEYVPIANARIVQSFSVPTAVMAADHFGFIVEELIVKSTEIIG